MIQVRRTRYAVMAWEVEKNRGIVYPATVSTDIQDFTCEVREIVQSKMRDMRFKTLVFDASYTTNYIPMREFLNQKEPGCVNVKDGDEKELYDFLQYDDNSARELYKFFFSHTRKVEYSDGYVEFEFVK